MKPFSKRFFPLVAATILSACGGGDSGGEENPPPPPPPNESPSISVIFPPHDGMLTAKETVTLRGTASDTDGHVQGVSVNGVEAESMDGYESWTVTVPLEIGDNALDVRVLDDGDGEAVRTVAVKRIKPPFPIYPTAVTVDPGTGRAFVSDSTGEQVAEINPETGEIVAMLAGPGIGSGARLGNPQSIVFDAANNRLFVANAEAGYAAVVAIDLSTMERTEISGPNRGMGDSLQYKSYGPPTEVAFDGMGKLYVANRGRLYIVDVATGDREAIPMYEHTNLLYDIELDRVTGLLYLSGSGSRVVAFNTGTGEILTIADAEDGKGVMLQSRDMALDGDTLYVMGINGFDGEEETLGLAAIAAVDLASGQRDAVFLDSRELEKFTRLSAIASLPNGNILALDGGAHSITRLDLAEQDMEPLITAEHFRGTGPHIAEPLRPTGTPTGGLFVIGAAKDLYHIEPSTGNRELIASIAGVRNEETGEEWELSPGGMVYDATGDALWIADAFSENPANYLYRFDVSTGELKPVSFQLAPSTVLNRVSQMQLSSDGQYLYLRNKPSLVDGTFVSEILEVDVKSHSVRAVVGGTEATRSLGSGPAINYPYSAFPHPAGNMLYVNIGTGMARVNLQTLEREMVELPTEFESMNIVDPAIYGDRFIAEGYDQEASVNRFALWQPGEAPLFFAQPEDQQYFGPVSRNATIVGSDTDTGILLVHTGHAAYLLDVETGEYLLMSH